ncbi:P-loop NTPase [Micromonospora humidisoli]|uniref:Novel STAND NTPase 5 domain-containing protein n=1 Tax=Micromonospora humidisoli TaxID=2807622 RepID=A0ABS2JIC5_9ACTN|nr:hypothetical protein [Micromonospora humidisoli]MBM7086247.1 hypothetical protein [Micromonospora humidisoli]
MDGLARDCVQAIAGLHQAGGALDALVLVGDLTVSGTTEEFGTVSSLVDLILSECCEAPGLAELPAVLAVPGRRDLTPMAAALATVRSVTDWWSQVEESFWNEETPDVHEAIRHSFSPFLEWYGNYSGEMGWRSGKLPGDGAFVLHAGGLRLGVATLNSVFRMLTVEAHDGLATLHASQLAAVASGSDWQQQADALVVLSPISAELSLPLPAIPLAGRIGSTEAQSWSTVGTGAHLYVAHRRAAGEVVLSDFIRGNTLKAVAPPVVEPATATARHASAEVQSVLQDESLLLDEFDQAIATGQAVLVITSGMEGESRGEWSSPLESADGLFAALVSQLPQEIAEGRVTLGAVMQRLRQVDPLLVRRTISGLLVTDGSTVNDTALRLMLAPWHRIYDCTGTNIFQEISARLDIGKNVVVIDAHRDPPGVLREQLEIVSMSGIAPGSSAAPVTFDIDDRGRGSRAQWFRQLKADLITHPVVFASESIDSAHLSLYLDTLTGDGGGEGSGAADAVRRRFVIAPGVDATVTWKLAGAGFGQIPISLVELAKRRLIAGRAPMQRGAQLRARTRQVHDRHAGVQLVSALIEGAPPGDPLYLRGTDPTWGDVKEAIPARLSTLSSVFSLAESPTVSKPVLVLNDRSGSGKSTTLMQFAVALHTKGLAVGWVDRATTKSSQDVIRECEELGLDAVLIDDVDIFGAEAARLMTRLGRRGTVLVAATIRSTRGHLLDEVAGLTRVPPLRLTADDLNALVYQLETYRQLGKLKKHRLHEARVERLREVANSDLMAAMVEVITGFRFEQRVSSEFAQLDERERIIYATVCMFEALQYEDRSLTLPQNALLQIASDGPPDPAVNRAIERLVSRRGMLVRRESGHIRTRHRVIAEALEKTIRDDKSYFLELFQRLLLFYVQRGAGIANRNDPTRRAMVALINHRVMIKSGLSVESVRHVYSQLHSYLKDDFHYWLQCGSYELEKRNLDLAATYLDTSRGCDGGQDHFKVVTTWGMICLRRASEHPTESSLHAEAVEAFGELDRVASQEGDRSPHTLVTIVRDGTHWLQRCVFFTNDEREVRARRILYWIKFGNRLLSTSGEFRSAARDSAGLLERILEPEGEQRGIPL